ncbi:uncharacterized protein [Oscarella lobularis]|uniref:uncharacterized protein n=1 Tax=Oscarella lobularis TaxID=121494 RepID=UPI0033136981
MKLLCLLVLSFVLTPVSTVFNPLDIETVHFVSSCHLDVGFADTAANIVNRYFDNYFKASISTSNTLRQMGGNERLVFLTHPYLLSLYLDCPPNMGLHCPDNDSIKLIEDGIGRGDISWHAMPFNSQLEVMDANLLNFSVKLGHDLDKRFNKPFKMTMSQRDVPGTSRAIIPTLVQNGVAAVTVGVNGGSMPPSVPSAFVWKNENTNDSVLGLWHPGGYGGQHGVSPSDVVTVEGFNQALVYGFRGDNSGPPSVKEVLSDFAAIRKMFPNATILSTDFEAFTQALLSVKDKLEVVTGEIGDTWIHGVASDPVKVSQIREIMRARTDCVHQAKCDETDARFYNFSRLLLKGPEHTWGGDTKKFLNDYTNWTNKDFHAYENSPNFVRMISTWVEQRNWAITYPLEALEDHPLRDEINTRLAGLMGQVPSTEGFEQVSNRSSVFSCGGVEIGFSSATGSITHLVNISGNIPLALSDYPLAQVVYQTFTQDDFETFLNEYSYINPTKNSWLFKDFGKPGLNGTLHQEVSPSLQELWQKKNSSHQIFLLHLTFPESVNVDYGAPSAIWEIVTVPLNKTDDFRISVEFNVINKTATRIPECLSIYFKPMVESSMKILKIGQPIDPMNVINNGSQHLHGLDPIDGKVFYESLEFVSLDTAIVSIGKPNPFPTPSSKPDEKDGFAFIITDNIWGTNYIMWFPFLPEEASTKYRLSVNLQLE